MTCSNNSTALWEVLLWINKNYVLGFLYYEFHTFFTADPYPSVFLNLEQVGRHRLLNILFDSVVANQNKPKPLKSQEILLKNKSTVTVTVKD